LGTKHQTQNILETKHQTQNNLLSVFWRLRFYFGFWTFCKIFWELNKGQVCHHRDLDTHSRERSVSYSAARLSPNLNGKSKVRKLKRVVAHRPNMRT
jgi:hypothetical protein